MEGLQIKVCEKQTTEKKEYDFRIMTSILFVTGWIWLSMSAFSFWEKNWLILAAIGALFCILFTVLWNSRWMNYVLPIGCLGGVALFAVGISYGKNGVYVLANEVLDFLTGKNGRIYLDYPVESENGVWFVGILILFFLTLFASYGIYRNHIWIQAILILPAAVGYWIGFLDEQGGWILIAAAAALMIFQKKGNTESFSKSSKWISIGILAGCICIAGVTGIFFRNLSADAVADSLKESIHTVRYDCGDTTMPEGDLSNLEGWEKSNTTALEITTANPEKMYFRGMTGERYTGTSWEGLSEETNQSAEDLFFWLHKAEFYGQAQIGHALGGSEDTDTYEMTIKNVGACQLYQYLPYATASTTMLDADAIGVKSTYADTKEQTISCYTGSVPKWYELEMQLAENQSQETVAEYLRYEQSYREFVFEQDLQLTNAAIGVCQRLFGESIETKSLYEIQNLILETLENTLTYQEAVVTSNGGNDFFQYTMEQSKQGYSVHYATAATLMLRYFGVPARYVEGYYLSGEEAAGYEAGDTILLNECHAHAWTEYYLDGVGWIPFEVTPGYIDEDEMEQISQIVQNNTNSDALGGAGFSQSKLQYTPPKYAPEDRKVTELNHTFRLQTEHVIGILIFLLLAALAAGLVFVWKRRRKLFRTLDEIHQMNHRDAITALFGYANMLMEKAHIQTLDGLEKIQEINREAMFSNHEMTEEQREETELFAVQVIHACQKVWNAWERFRYHYILWIYR